MAGVVVRQRAVAANWAAECKCARPGPMTTTDVVRTLRADEIGPEGQVYTKHGLGLTDNIQVRVDLPSICGGGTRFDAARRQCVAATGLDALRRACGAGTHWDADARQCVRTTTCAPAAVYGGDVCMPPPKSP